MAKTRATLRRGSFTIGDSLLMLLGALITLVGLTFFKIRSLDRIEGKVHHPLPERSSECTERAEDCHAGTFEEPAPPDAPLDGVEVFKTSGRDAVGKHDALGTLASNHAAPDEALGNVYVVVGQRFYRLTPMTEEELEKLPTSAVGVFGSIGFHAGNNTKTHIGKAMTKKEGK